jgi:hypothetical protein
MARALVRTAGQNQNYAINGNMSFWQRGTSFTSGNPVVYTADRWVHGRDAFAAGGNVTQQAGNGNNSFCARVGRTNGNSNTGRIYLFQLIEIDTVKNMAGKTFTLSWKARKGAGFSAASSNLQATIYTGTGSSQQSSQTVFNSGFTGQAVAAQSNIPITSTSSFDTYSLTATLGAGVTQMSIEFNYTPTGTAGTTDYFEVTDVMLNEGSTAQPYTYAANVYASEFALCQRYYEVGRSYDRLDWNPGANASAGMSMGFAVTKRATPVCTILNNSSSGQITSFAIDGITAEMIALTCTMVTASVTPRILNIGWSADAEI